MFRVTGAILRAGHGQVECGQCHSIFDAIEHLIDDVPPGPMPEPAAALEPATALGDSQTENGEASLSSGEMQWANDLPTGEFQLKDGEIIPVADRGSAEIPDENSEARYFIEEPGEPEEITLEGDSIEISGVYRTAEHAAPGAPTEEEAEPLLQPLHSTAAPHSSYRRAAANPFAAQEDLAADQGVHEGDARRAVTWGILSLLLLIGLAVQVVHHYRQDLVRDPRLGPELLKLYSTLNLPLAPNWDVTGYQIQQWGVAADPAASGTLRLRASILNRAGFAQPYPLLKLSLEDRWGEQVGAREFEPSEYLSPGTPADRLLAPNQPVNADIGIVDPGEDAVGFHVDVCLRGFAGLDCASRTP